MGKWNWLALVTNTEVIPALLIMLFYFKETPRWLLQKGRVEEANRVAKLIARRNGIGQVDELIAPIEEDDLSSPPPSAREIAPDYDRIMQAGVNNQPTVMRESV